MARSAGVFLILLASAASAHAWPIIDVHEHLVLTHAETERLVGVMDRENVATMILLDTPAVTFGDEDGFVGYDDTVERQLAMKRAAPGRFRVLYSFPPYDHDGPSKFARLAERGIDGLKFYNGVLWEDLGSIDSRAMYQAYDAARAKNLPVTIHVEALNPIQRMEFERALDAYADVAFVCPHLCGVERNLKLLDAMLARHPNLFTDIGPWHRVGVFAIKDPDRFGEFFTTHSTRMMFATDTVKENTLRGDPDIGERIECTRALLETRFFACARDASVMHGLHLSGTTLEDIYARTAARVYRIATAPDSRP